MTDPQEWSYRKLTDLPSKSLRRHTAQDFCDESFVRELDQSGYIDGLYKPRN